jgi:phosphoglucosamine mutase
VGVEPNGLNINDGVGATVPSSLKRAVLEHKADIGIALDGDGDRVLMADRDGTLYDGDQLLYVMARQGLQEGRVEGLVGTLMTNLGLEHALERLGIAFARARVGDRYVLEMMHEKGWRLGGENSGHIICLDRHTTGDGIVSALQVLAALRRQGITLAQACRDLTLYPQTLINVKLPQGFDWKSAPGVQAARDAAQRELGGNGRVLLRPSGTEPLLRVMVEGREGVQVERLAQTIAQAVKAAAA